MAAAAKQANKIARSIPKGNTDSTIAKIPQTTDTPTVRAAKPVALKTGANFTGQYLYDRFVNDKAENKADLTKMDIVRQMCDVMEPNEFGVTVDGMVGFANRDYKAAVEAAKQAGNYDSENPTWPIREAQARLRTARNHKTVMQNAYGALKFCAKELEAKLNGAPLAYRMIREIGSKLLGDKGINWKGEKMESPDGRAARREQQTETAVMLEVQKENPRKESESRAEYYTRIDGLVDKAMAVQRKAQHADTMAKLADKIKAMCGGDLPDIIEILLSGDSKAEAVEKGKTIAKADPSLH